MSRRCCWRSFAECVLDIFFLILICACGRVDYFEVSVEFIYWPYEEIMPQTTTLLYFSFHECARAARGEPYWLFRKSGMRTQHPPHHSHSLSALKVTFCVLVCGDNCMTLNCKSKLHVMRPILAFQENEPVPLSTRASSYVMYVYVEIIVGWHGNASRQYSRRAILAFQEKLNENTATPTPTAPPTPPLPRA